MKRIIRSKLEEKERTFLEKEKKPNEQIARLGDLKARRLIRLTVDINGTLSFVPAKYMGVRFRYQGTKKYGYVTSVHTSADSQWNAYLSLNTMCLVKS